MTEPQHTGYAVTDWDDLFETDDKGGRWCEGKPFRRGPLNYLRLPTVGTFARRMVMIRTIAADDALSIEGLFFRVLGLVAGLDRDQRAGGVIRGVDGQPAATEDVADILGLPHEVIERGIAILTDRRVGLLRALTEDDITPIPGDSAESRGIPRNSGAGPGAGPGAIQGRAIQSNTEQNKSIPDESSANSEGDSEPEPRPSREVATDFSLRWESACLALRTAFGEHNQTVEDFRRWFGNRSVNLTYSQSANAISRLNELIEKSRHKDNPAGYFIGCVKKPPDDGGFGYRPVGRTGDRTAKLADVLR